MKQVIKILAALLLIAVVMTVAVSCKGTETGETDISTEETTEKTKNTKKQYTPTIDPGVYTTADTDEQKQPEETGPIDMETDEDDRFSDAVDMH